MHIDIVSTETGLVYFKQRLILSSPDFTDSCPKNIITDRKPQTDITTSDRIMTMHGYDIIGIWTNSLLASSEKV